MKTYAELKQAALALIELAVDSRRMAAVERGEREAAESHRHLLAVLELACQLRPGLTREQVADLIEQHRMAEADAAEAEEAALAETLHRRAMAAELKRLRKVNLRRELYRLQSQDTRPLRRWAEAELAKGYRRLRGWGQVYLAAVLREAANDEAFDGEGSFEFYLAQRDERDHDGAPRLTHYFDDDGNICYAVATDQPRELDQQGRDRAQRARRVNPDQPVGAGSPRDPDAPWLVLDVSKELRFTRVRGRWYHKGVRVPTELEQRLHWLADEPGAKKRWYQPPPRNAQAVAEVA